VAQPPSISAAPVIASNMFRIRIALSLVSRSA
jgi:hypothetical protein